MTATATPPRPAPARPTPATSSPASGAQPEPPLANDPFLGSAVSLALLSVVAVAGMGRLFADGGFFGPVLAAALVVHLASWWGRRAGLGLASGLAVSMGALALAIAWVELPRTTAYGIPWTGTWRAAAQALDAAWGQFSQVVAPAPVTRGFVISAMAGAGVTAMLADWAAYRVRTTFEPLLPSFTLFLFTSALGTAHGRGLATAAYVAAALLFLVVHQAALRAETTAWFASRSRRGIAALLQGGVVIGIAAVVASVVIGPNLPGAKSKAVIAWRRTGGTGGGDRVTTSPLVDIRGRLVSLSDVEVFSVKSTARAYWQLTTLDTFDGRIWSSNRNYSDVKHGLPGGIPDDVAANHVVQDFAIEGLDSIWLPVAYQPTRIEGIDHVSYNAALGSLITAGATSNNTQYKVDSEVPEFRPEQLRTAQASTPDPAFVALPPIPAAVAVEARRVTAGATTAYDKALALQNYFRDNFTYSLDVRPGHDDRALERFLFRDRKGYCEQFAGTYAVMARSLGLPTRVAVGFTPGEMGSDGRFHVRGLNAHAWPEVYLGQFGWVSFEPTPGRGQPGAQAWTGVPDEQASAAQPSVNTTAPPTTATTAATPNGSTPTTRNRDQNVDSGGRSAGAGSHKPLAAWLKAAIGLGVVLLVWALGVPLLLNRRRAGRRAAASSASDRVVVAWDEACEALAVADTAAGRRPAETVHEYAARAPAAARLNGSTSKVAEAMRSLAGLTAAASYGAEGSLPAEAVARSMAAADVVHNAVDRSLGWRKRLWWRVDPRPLVHPRVRELVTRSGGRG
jgi:transglutaminase-like putative cysteine protease